MDILVYTPEEFAPYQSVPGSFTHTVAREGRVLFDPGFEEFRSVPQTIWGDLLKTCPLDSLQTLQKLHQQITELIPSS